MRPRSRGGDDGIAPALDLALNQPSQPQPIGGRPGVQAPPPPAPLIPLIRLLVGLWRFWRRLLGWQPGDSLVRQQDLVGQRGRVLLSCSRSLRGLVRLQVRGSLIDSPAYGMDERPLLEGDRVMVLHQQGHDLWVTAISFSDPP